MNIGQSVMQGACLLAAKMFEDAKTIATEALKNPEYRDLAQQTKDAIVAKAQEELKGIIQEKLISGELNDASIAVIKSTITNYQTKINKSLSQRVYEALQQKLKINVNAPQASK